VVTGVQRGDDLVGLDLGEWISRARTASHRREDEQWVATERDSEGLKELVASFPRTDDLRLVFDAADVGAVFARGADFALVVQVRGQLHKTAQQRISELSKNQVRQIAASSFEVSRRHGEWPAHHFDVVLCRRD